MRSKLLAMVVAVVGVVALAAPAGADELVVNGSFETGDFSGWTVVNQEGGSGDWFVYATGEVAPLADDSYGDVGAGSTLPIPDPPDGEFAAISDQTGPGSHLLYQDVALPAGQTCSLTMTVYYENGAGELATPDTLDYTVDPNQQYRIDLMDPAAPVESVGAGDVLRPLFRTEVGDPQSLAPTVITADLSDLAGSTVRLRFAEADNLDNFNAGVDGVSIDCVPAATPIVIQPSFTG